MRKRQTKNGIALIIVLSVITLLFIIAIPFTISMRLQERTSKSYAFETRARYGAEGAKNAAVAQLFKTNEHLERFPEAQDPCNTPEYDTVEEFGVSLHPLGERARDPKGEIWSAGASDGQACINITTAPPHVIENLEKFCRPGEFEKSITAHSGRPAEWITPQRVRAISIVPDTEIHDDDSDDEREGPPPNTTTVAISVTAPWFFGPQTRIRLIHVPQDDDSQLPRFSISADASGLMAHIDEKFAEKIAEDFSRLWVEAEARHPVNVNTASVAVLKAVLVGLSVQSQAVDDADAITCEEAEAIVERVFEKGVLKGFEDFYNVLAEAENAGEISAADFAAAYYNAINPNLSPLDDTGTLPFCYASYDILHVEAGCIVSNPSGDEVSRHIFEEVVDTSPPGTLIWTLDSQNDFELTKMSISPMTFNEGPFTPFGNKVVTFPTNIWAPLNWPSFSHETDEGDVRLSTARDLRVRKKPFIKTKVDHCDSMPLGTLAPHQEGVELVKDPLVLPSARRLGKEGSTFDINVGAFEIWLKPKALEGDTYILDTGEAEDRNRLRLWVDDSGDLVFSVWDPTLDGGFSEVRSSLSSFNHENDRWFHFGAFWKGTHHGELALLVDGFPKGEFFHRNRDGDKVTTELTSSLSETGTTVNMRSTADFPPTGVIEIGDEAIEYATTGLGSLSQVVRGARGTKARRHPAGSPVSIYGYSNPLFRQSLNFMGIPIEVGKIPTGGGKASEAIPQAMETNLWSPGAPPRPGEPLITETETVIPVASTDSFQSSGYILVGSPPLAEVVYYGAKMPTAFIDCERGALGTTAMPHMQGESVSGFSFIVDDNENYNRIGMVAVDDEWFFCQKVTNHNKDYFAGVTLGAVPIPAFRAVLNTTLAAHASSTDVFPVFMTENPYCGAGDMVTILDTQGRREGVLREVHMTRMTFVSLAENVSQAYEGVSGGRLLKFPSGELPVFLPEELTIGGPHEAAVPKTTVSKASTLRAMIDEVKFSMAAENSRDWVQVKNRLRLEEEISQIDDEMVVNVFPGTSSLRSPDQATQILEKLGLWNSGGIIKVGEEFIAYDEMDVRIDEPPAELRNFLGLTDVNCHLKKCTRGVLRTKAASHPGGSPVMPMLFLVATTLKIPMDEGGAALEVRATDGFAPQGFALVGEEVIGYTWMKEQTLWMPLSPDGYGLFRGAFGTASKPHSEGDLVYAIPHRYWDFYSPYADDNQVACFQASKVAEGAAWKRITWDESAANEFVEPVVLVRMDDSLWSAAAMPPLSGDRRSPRTQDTGEKSGSASGTTLQRILEFRDPEERNEINLPGDVIEVKILFEYKDGAFDTNAWKETPAVQSIRVEYEKPTRVLMHRDY